MIEKGDIHVKDVSVLVGLMERRFAPLLIEIISMVARRWGVMITESYREKRHMNDLHGTQPVRAVDLRFWDYESYRAAYNIANEINKTWQYDPHRPEKMTAIVHDSGQGIHFHIQVHPRTIRRSF